LLSECNHLILKKKLFIKLYCEFVNNIIQNYKKFLLERF
jgi:hypothetical protein